jgi:CheY-like chemotaxis protein
VNLPDDTMVPRAAVAQISHDVNNWLGLILGNATLLRYAVAGDPAALRQLDEIRQAVKASAALIRTLNDHAALAAPSPNAAVAAPPPTSTGTAGAPAVVLVVDDDIGIRTLVQRVLQRPGLVVQTAVDGSDALRVLGSLEHVDAVVLDLTMPGATSATVVDEGRRRNPPAGVIVMSGVHDTELEDHVPGVTDLHFLRKPFDNDDLVAAASAVLPTLETG